MTAVYFLMPTKEPAFFSTTFSHKGLVRENNEDHLRIQSFLTNESRSRSVFLAVLADGVGGHSAGEVASKIGVDTIFDVVSSCDNLENPTELLENAITAANTAIVEDAALNESRKGMGSTCVCALLIGHRLTIANLGDSRLYLIRGDKIQQLTFDHTWLEEITGKNIPGAGKIDRSHPLAHVLNRYLGSREPIHVDLRIRWGEDQSDEKMHANQGMKLSTGDILLLMSDGISDLLDDEDIKDIATNSPPKKIAKKMVFSALERGGHDNASIIAIVI